MVLVAHRPASARGRLDIEPGRVSLVISYFPRPGSASRRMSSRQQTDTNRSVSARRRRSQSRLARTASRALTGRLADRTPGDRTDRDRSQAVQTGASGSTWIPPSRSLTDPLLVREDSPLGEDRRRIASARVIFQGSGGGAAFDERFSVFSPSCRPPASMGSREIWRDVAQLEQDRKRP